MGRKKLVAYEVVKRKEYGYEPVETRAPSQTAQPTEAVPVQQYVKRNEQKPKSRWPFGRRKFKSDSDRAADELNETADILEGGR